ncbi:hypothetical protein T03_2817 [Trichinella britovi]|uniref:Uncharacterized protein n=1 Tax=Trichinella britovi TaxID=45882 RepID=A0A0V1CXF7_TRIBR|nr:hypothetical protein T03_2817 [Trichinella britovi]
MHGILEAPEETDYSGITSITISRTRRRDRQEKRTRMKPLKEKKTWSPAGILEVPTRLEEEEVVEERSTGCKERTEEGAMLRANLKKYLPSGYARGYASGKISGTLGATPPAKFFVIFEEIAPGYALRST